MKLIDTWRARKTARAEHAAFLDWCEREAARAFHATTCGSMCPCGASEPDEPLAEIYAELRGVRIQRRYEAGLGGEADSSAQTAGR